MQMKGFSRKYISSTSPGVSQVCHFKIRNIIRLVDYAVCSLEQTEHFSFIGKDVEAKSGKELTELAHCSTTQYRLLVKSVLCVRLNVSRKLLIPTTGNSLVRKFYSFISSEIVYGTN